VSTCQPRAWNLRTYGKLEGYKRQHITSKRQGRQKDTLEIVQNGFGISLGNQPEEHRARCTNQEEERKGLRGAELMSEFTSTKNLEKNGGLTVVHLIPCEK
jgi:hypothetical protein